jgi:hypothetical protein
VISSLIGGVIGYFIWTLSEVMFILYPSHVKIATICVVEFDLAASGTTR